MPTHLAIDSFVHHRVIHGIVQRGVAPTVAELAHALGSPPGDIEDSLRRLADNHGLVLHPHSLDIWIAHPFSLSPTAVWVAGGTRGWWAPCLWCAFGVVALAAPSAAIHCRLGGESRELVLRVRDGRLLDDELFVHFPVPPRHAWANVHHFCSMVLPFQDEAEVDAWCERHGLPRGAVVPIAQVHELGREWYGSHLDEQWAKWTVAEARAIFGRAGLTGEFWTLPAAEGRF